MLLFKNFINNKDAPLDEQYASLRKLYNEGGTYILINCSKVFGPFPKPSVPWTISELQEIVTYNPELCELTNWINRKIILQLDLLNYYTLGVLIRIATGMLNKIDIPKGYKLILHEHMVKNIQNEHFKIITESLPFVEPAEPGEDKPF